VAEDDREEEGQSRPLEIPVPTAEGEAEALPPTLNVEPIRQLLRQEIYVVRQELRQEIRQEIRAELHIGPLPHERTLEGYERIVPGSAEKIINAFVAQGEHRQELETYALKWDNIRSFAGLGAGFIISILVIAVAYDLIRTGHGAEGAILIAIDLVGLVAVFIYGSQVRRDERIRKAEVMVGPGERRTKTEPKELPE
jgi:uncharacterized membrane protein